eukprot:TRINITY_DN18418_c0_g1_i1.p1 TRINITY_DN18418_c0_g1~~TRINITY_DN18418_c0_g1_i1.p1  ORF type:complete len:755 (+),score=183.94 TRINITY_DN18418_c0_g1_i1:57-2267(+)
MHSGLSRAGSQYSQRPPATGQRARDAQKPEAVRGLWPPPAHFERLRARGDVKVAPTPSGLPRQSSLRSSTGPRFDRTASIRSTTTAASRAPLRVAAPAAPPPHAFPDPSPPSPAATPPPAAEPSPSERVNAMIGRLVERQVEAVLGRWGVGAEAGSPPGGSPYRPALLPPTPQPTLRRSGSRQRSAVTCSTPGCGVEAYVDCEHDGGGSPLCAVCFLDICHPHSGRVKYVAPPPTLAPKDARAGRANAPRDVKQREAAVVRVRGAVRPPSGRGSPRPSSGHGSAHGSPKTDSPPPRTDPGARTASPPEVIDKEPDAQSDAQRADAATRVVALEAELAAATAERHLRERALRDARDERARLAQNLEWASPRAHPPAGDEWSGSWCGDRGSFRFVNQRTGAEVDALAQGTPVHWTAQHTAGPLPAPQNVCAFVDAVGTAVVLCAARYSLLTFFNGTAHRPVSAVRYQSSRETAAGPRNCLVLLFDGPACEPSAERERAVPLTPGSTGAVLHRVAVTAELAEVPHFLWDALRHLGLERPPGSGPTSPPLLRAGPDDPRSPRKPSRGLPVFDSIVRDLLTDRVDEMPKLDPAECQDRCGVLAMSLKSNRSLRQCDLSGLDLGDTNTAQVIRALDGHPSLTSLSIGGNGAACETAAALRMATNLKLERLDVGPGADLDLTSAAGLLAHKPSSSQTSARVQASGSELPSQVSALDGRVGPPSLMSSVVVLPTGAPSQCTVHG